MMELVNHAIWQGGSAVPHSHN